MLYIWGTVSIQSPPLSASGVSAIALLRTVGKAEGASFLLLLGVAMPLKYLAGVLIAVKLVGWLHGALFILLLGALGRARLVGGLPVKLCIAVVVGSLLPLGPFFVDRWLAVFVAPGKASPSS